MADEAVAAPWKTACWLAAVTLLAFLLVIANPGFYSHDEWQKADFVREHGWTAFARAYGVVAAGPEFGTPVRPIGFLQQGLSALWMTRAPVVPHLLDVVMHALAVVGLWFVLRAARIAEVRARLAALVFALSPLAAMATAWVAASFDHWYVLFFLVAAFGWLRAMQRGGWLPLAWITLGSAGAILSKETAMVLPGALLLLAWVQWRRGEALPPPSRAAAMLACAAVPVLVYLAIRWPALQATLASGGGPYAPSPARMPGNALLYFAYPFVPGGVETITVRLLPRWQFLFGLGLHAGLLALLWRRVGGWWMLAYVAGYFVFLLPVLMLPITGAHYLYGPGIAFSLAWAAVLAPTGASRAGDLGRFRGGAIVGAVVLAALGMRSVWIQQAVYSEGRCQSEFIASYEPMAEAAVAAGARRLVLEAAPGARDYVATKALFGRPQFGPEGRWPTVRDASAVQAGDGRLLMLPDCRVARR